MDEREIDAPFPREPWKRQLEDPGNAPPETTDARIRASARKAVTPHAARWWVHAGLAASFVVAVVIAQALFGGSGRDPAGESKVNVSLIDQPNAVSPPSQPEAAAAPLRKEAPKAAGQAAIVEADDYEEPSVGEVAEVETTSSRVGGPERDRRAASEAPEESFMTDPAAPESKELSNVVVTGSRADAAAEESADSRALGESAAFVSWQRTPEDWYARIVALRKAGSNAEADAELKRFEAAWPDWMKQHGKPRP
jgi:hypothetical protein